MILAKTSTPLYNLFSFCEKSVVCKCFGFNVIIMVNDIRNDDVGYNEQ